MSLVVEDFFVGLKRRKRRRVLRKRVEEDRQVFLEQERRLFTKGLWSYETCVKQIKEYLPDLWASR